LPLFVVAAGLVAQTLALGGGHAGPRAPSAVNVAPIRSRILVKLRPSLAGRIEEALGVAKAVTPGGATANADARGFLTRYHARSLAPLYPDLVRAKLRRGVSAEREMPR